MDSCNGSSGDVVCGDGVGGKGESPVENPPIRGILKASSFQSNNTKKSIRWDEDKISQMESQRGTRMKIDEPKTPYVRSFKYDNLTEEEKAELEAGEAIDDEDFVLECGYIDPAGGDRDSSSKDEWSSSESQEGCQEENNSKEFHAKSFEAKRAEHYNFRNYIALCKQKLDDDENEDEEDEEDDDVNEGDVNEDDDDDNASGSNQGPD